VLFFDEVGFGVTLFLNKDDELKRVVLLEGKLPS